MVVTVFSYWGVRCCEDIGHMVFNLDRRRNFRENRRGFDRGFQERLRFSGRFRETVRAASRRWPKCRQRCPRRRFLDLPERVPGAYSRLYARNRPSQTALTGSSAGDHFPAQLRAEMGPAQRAHDHRAGRPQRAGRECAGVVRDGQHRRGRASRRRACRTFSSTCFSRERRRARRTPSRRRSRMWAATSTPTLPSIARFTGSMSRKPASRPPSMSCGRDDELHPARRPNTRRNRK